jgi:hypothetical protein
MAQHDPARLHVLRRELVRRYRDMAADEERERDATEWVEGLTGDIADEFRRTAAPLPAKRGH